MNFMTMTKFNIGEEVTDNGIKYRVTKALDICHGCDFGGVKGCSVPDDWDCTNLIFKKVPDPATLNAEKADSNYCDRYDNDPINEKEMRWYEAGIILLWVLIAGTASILKDIITNIYNATLKKLWQERKK